MSNKEKQVREMTDAEITERDKMLTMAFGISQETINRVNHKATCIYIMGTIMDDYVEYIDSVLKRYLIRSGRLNIAMQDINAASKRWSKAFSQLCLEIDGHIVKGAGSTISSEYELLKGMIEAFMNEEEGNWNWQQRYLYRETVHQKEMRRAQLEIAGLAELNKKLLEKLEENNISIKL